MDVVLEAQAAVYSLLKSDTALGGLVGNIYDFVPAGAGYPYVTIGQATVKDSSALGVVGFEVDLAVNVYSQAMGRKETLTILQRIYELLADQNLAVSGYLFVAANFTGMSASRLGNGDFSGRVSFKILLKAGS